VVGSFQLARCSPDFQSAATVAPTMPIQLYVGREQKTNNPEGQFCNRPPGFTSGKRTPLSVRYLSVDVEIHLTVFRQAGV